MRNRQSRIGETPVLVDGSCDERGPSEFTVVLGGAMLEGDAELARRRGSSYHPQHQAPVEQNRVPGQR